MAYLQCPECNADVSSKDITCPNCGKPLSPLSAGSWAPTIRLDRIADRENRPWQIALVVALCVGLAVLFFMNLPGKKAIFNDQLFEVGAGKAQAFDFVLSEKAKLTESLQVMAGPSVDVMLMTQSQYMEYQTKMADAYAGGIAYESSLSAKGTSTLHETTQLDKGTYYLVVRPVQGLPQGAPADVSRVKLTLTAEW